MFSIVIPVYNVAPYLRECLDSVLAQTFTDWEAICVDDGSTDGSGVILDEYATLDKRFQVAHQRNAGVSAARNVALERGNGEWVCFVDSDDIVSTNWLERLNEVISAHPAVEYVRWGSERIQEAKNLVINTGGEVSFHASSGMLDFDDYYVPLWRAAYRKSIIGNLRFSDYVRGEDALFNTKYVLRIKNVVVLDEKLYGYRIRPNSALTGKITSRKLRDEVRYRMDCLNAIYEGRKRADSRILRQHENFLMVTFVRYMAILTFAEQKNVLDDWRNAVRAIMAKNYISCPNMILSVICCKVKSVLLFKAIFGINYLIRRAVPYMKGRYV